MGLGQGPGHTLNPYYQTVNIHSSNKQHIFPQGAQVEMYCKARVASPSYVSPLVELLAHLSGVRPTHHTRLVVLVLVLAVQMVHHLSSYNSN